LITAAMSPIVSLRSYGAVLSASAVVVPAYRSAAWRARYRNQLAGV